jgi:hypothetical protein
MKEPSIVRTLKWLGQAATEDVMANTAGDHVTKNTRAASTCRPKLDFEKSKRAVPISCDELSAVASR